MTYSLAPGSVAKRPAELASPASLSELQVLSPPYATLTPGQTDWRGVSAVTVALDDVSELLA